MKKRKYICLHCQTEWDEDYLAELCFKIDMDNLTKGKDEKRNNMANNGSRNKPGIKYNKGRKY